MERWFPRRTGWELGNRAEKPSIEILFSQSTKEKPSPEEHKSAIRPKGSKFPRMEALTFSENNNVWPLAQANTEPHYFSWDFSQLERLSLGSRDLTFEFFQAIHLGQLSRLRSLELTFPPPRSEIEDGRFARTVQLLLNKLLPTLHQLEEISLEMCQYQIFCPVYTILRAGGTGRGIQKLFLKHNGTGFLVDAFSVQDLRAIRTGCPQLDTLEVDVPLFHPIMKSVPHLPARR